LGLSFLSVLRSSFIKISPLVASFKEIDSLHFVNKSKIIVNNLKVTKMLQGSVTLTIIFMSKSLLEKPFCNTHPSNTLISCYNVCIGRKLKRRKPLRAIFLGFHETRGLLNGKEI